MKVIFIPGIFANTVSKLFGPYFEDQIVILNRLGIPSEIAPIFQEQKREILRLELISYLTGICEEYEELVVVTHSKGGVDILDALIYAPELMEKVKKVVTIQAPYFGSPIAEILTSKSLRFLSKKLMKKFYKGEIDSLDELTPDYRKKYMENYKSEINHILNKVKFYNFASYKKVKPLEFSSVLKPSIHIMNAGYKQKSDGLVPLESALMDSCEHIIFENLDHASAVVPKKISNFDKDKFNKKLLEIITQ